MPKLSDGPKLTARNVNAIKPTSRDVVYWDPEIRGFGLRVYPSGARIFVVQYKNAEDRSRRMTIGALGGKMTADRARNRAKEILGTVAKGGDPVEERRKRKAGDTVRDLADRYLEEHAKPKKKPSSIKTDQRLLRLVILPELGRMKAVDVTRADVARMHHDHRSTPVQANRAVSLLSKMMRLAERWGLRPDGSNPCRNIDRHPEKPRKRYLSPAEVARLGEALTAAERGDGKEHPSAILAVRLLILTGCRRSEILQLRWSEVDFTRRVLALGDSKTGEKDVPLGAPALELLARADRQEGNPFVCWGDTSRLPKRQDDEGPHPAGHFIGIDKSWRRIRAAAGLPGVRLHDLRHSFASFGVGRGLGLPIIGGLLGHSTPATTQRYAHLSDNPLRQAADMISAEIAVALEGGPGGTLVHLTTR